jgi:ubiquinone/menaquinone biosynthesis C-methylase UbiE
MVINPVWKSLVTPEEIEPCVGHYLPAVTCYTNGYSLLKERLAPGVRVLEIGCGDGDLSLYVARQGAHAVAMDQELNRELILSKIQPGEQLSIELVQGKLGLIELPSNHFDVVVGQACLHHLTDNFSLYSSEILRMLKPDGCAIFIGEPLSHNPLFEAMRAVRMTRTQWRDEAGLYFGAIEDFGRSFSETRVYTHLLAAFLLKAVSQKFASVKVRLEQAEQRLVRHWPAWAKYCASMNVVFVR